MAKLQRSERRGATRNSGTLETGFWFGSAEFCVTRRKEVGSLGWLLSMHHLNSRQAFPRGSGRKESSAPCVSYAAFISSPKSHIHVTRVVCGRLAEMT